MDLLEYKKHKNIDIKLNKIKTTENLSPVVFILLNPYSTHIEYCIYV